MRCLLFILNFIFIRLVLAKLPRLIEASVKDTSVSHLVNVHLRYLDSLPEEHVFTYGDCDTTDAAHEQIIIGKSSGILDRKDDIRLVWAVPNDVPPKGCISAWVNGAMLVSKSEPILLRPSLAKRDRIPMTNQSGIDAEGPWFDGVNRLKIPESGAVDVQMAKNKR